MRLAQTALLGVVVDRRAAAGAAPDGDAAGRRRAWRWRRSAAAGARSAGATAGSAGRRARSPARAWQPAATCPFVSGVAGALADESMVGIENIEGQMRASSIRRLSELVEKHPEESLSIMRAWMHAGSRVDEPHATDDLRALTGAQKAAVLMLALGEDQCARLFGMMHEDEIKEISPAMAQLGPVRSDAVERLCHEFAESLGGAGKLVGSYESTERLLVKTLPRERVTQIMEEIRGPAGRTMWDKLGNVNEAVLANYLKNEYPQTVAVVLSKMQARPCRPRADAAARKLRHGSGDAHAAHGGVQKEVLDDVERTLRNEFLSNLARSTRRDSHELMAEIFNSLDRQTETRFITALEERNREAAERIKALMFTFEDLQRLTPAGDPDAAAHRREGQAAARAQGRVGDAARPVLRQHVRARRQDAARGDRGARARCGCATSTRRRPTSSRWPRTSRRRARSTSPRARKTSWCTDMAIPAPRPRRRRTPSRHPVRRGFRRAPRRHRARRAAERRAAAGLTAGRPARRPARPPMPRAIATASPKAAADRAEVTLQMLRAIAERLDAAARRGRARWPRSRPTPSRGCCWPRSRTRAARRSARHGAAEVAALARAVLPALRTSRASTMRVSPHVVAAVEAGTRTGSIAELRSRIALVPTDAVRAGRCAHRLAGRRRRARRAALWRDVAEALRRSTCLPARRAAPQPLDPCRPDGGDTMPDSMDLTELATHATAAPSRPARGPRGTSRRSTTSRSPSAPCWAGPPCR